MMKECKRRNESSHKKKRSTKRSAKVVDGRKCIKLSLSDHNIFSQGKNSAGHFSQSFLSAVEDQGTSGDHLQPVELFNPAGLKLKLY